MPSTSPSQQRLMGAALAFKRGDNPNASPGIRKVAEGMSEKQLGDFAATSFKKRADGGEIDAALSIARRAAGGLALPRTSSLAQQVQPLADRPYGFTVGFGGGRQDKNQISVAAGSYVLPSDIVAGLGEGNSLAGARIWDSMLNAMPWNVQAPKIHGKSGAPSPPHDAYLAQGITGGGQQQFADGGETPEVPILSADGEYVLSDEDVLRIGQHYSPQRDIDNYPASHDRIMRRAHRVLDDFVKIERGKTIKHLRGLKGPVGSKDASKGHI